LYSTKNDHRSYAWSADGYKYESGTSERFGEWLTSEAEEEEEREQAFWETGDVIGCGYNNSTGEIFYTKNGVLIGVGHTEVRAGLYPVVALAGPRAKVYANFGQMPFLFTFSFVTFRPPRKHIRLSPLARHFRRCVQGQAGLRFLIETAHTDAEIPQSRSEDDFEDRFKRAIPTNLASPRARSYFQSRPRNKSDA
jgi:hypothetical protein